MKSALRAISMNTSHSGRLRKLVRKSKRWKTKFPARLKIYDHSNKIQTIFKI